MFPGFSPPQSTGRVSWLDGLRGIAALAVVIHHLTNAAKHSFSIAIPSWWLLVGEAGRFGVDVFFVISGFVIAYSLRDFEPTLTNVGRFALRRSIRLDPPYWATIALEVAMVAASARVVAGYVPVFPSPADVGIHMVYLQGLLGRPQIVSVFWSLTYEVQFYFITALAIVGWHRLRGRIFAGAHRASAEEAGGAARPIVMALAVSTILSAVLFIKVESNPWPGLFWERWFQFGLGVFAFLSMENKIARWGLAVSVLAIAACLVSGAVSAYRFFATLTAALTVTVIAVPWLNARLSKIAAGPVFLWFGAISYSLYLVHVPIGERAIKFGAGMLATDSPLIAVTVYVISFAFCVVVAAAFHRILELPSIQLAKKVTLRRSARRAI